jgi:hypothetical protein
MRGPNAKTIGYGRGGQPTPSATALRNAYVIEESERCIRTECAHPKGEYYQAMIVLLREAIQYAEHGFPLTWEMQLFSCERDLHLCHGWLK